MSARKPGPAELDLALTGLYERLSSWEEGIAEEVGLSPRQCHAVAELGRSGRIRMKALAARLGISTGTLTVMADRLAKQGLVLRESDPEDGRASFLSLSPKGKAVAEEHGRRHAALYREVGKAIGAAASAQLVAILERIGGIDFPSGAPGPPGDFQAR
jgi:DNA-binding MarR family transcriptional regulator